MTCKAHPPVSAAGISEKVSYVDLSDLQTKHLRLTRVDEGVFLHV